MDYRIKFLKNAFWNLLQFVWPIVLSLIATPYIVKKLGADLYGIFSLVSVTLGFFALLDLGLSTATVKYVAEFLGKRKWEKINEIVNINLFAYGFLGLLGAIIILTFSKFLAVPLLKIPPQFASLARFCFYIAAGGFFVNFLSATFRSLAPGLQRYDVPSKINIVGGTLNVVTNVLLLYFGYSLQEIVIFNLLFSLAYFFIYYHQARRLLPSLKLQLQFKKNIFFMLFNYGILTFFAKTFGVIVAHLDKFLISGILGLNWVAFYVIPSNLTSKINGFVGAMEDVIFPTLSEFAGKGEAEKAQRVYKELMRLSLFLGLSLCLPIWALGDKFLLFWLGGEFAAKSTLVLYWLVGTSFLLIFGNPAWNVLLASGYPFQAAFFSGFMAILDIVLLFILAPIYGVTGAGMAYFLSVLIGNSLLVFFVERKILKLDGAYFFKFLSKSFILAVFIFIEAMIFKKLAVNIFTTIFLMGLLFFSYWILFVSFGMYTEEDKQLVKTLFKKFLK